MAAFTLIFTPTTTAFGRSGYNRDGDDEEGQNKGRSGYNKDGKPDGEGSDTGNQRGRSGYNKGGRGDEDDE